MTVGEKVWHCKKLYETDEGVIVYDEPKEYTLRFNYLTLSPTSGYLATLQYGEKLSKMWNMKAIKSVFNGVFGEGDLLYIDGNKPDLTNKEYTNGDGANALVTSVLPYLVSYSITLERIEP